MITLAIKAVKQGILEASKVTDPAERAALKVHQKFGAYVRRRSRSSIKDATGKRSVSQPGQPPVSHSLLLKDYILFVATKQNCIIGPMKLNKPVSDTALTALELGGPTLIMKHGKPKSVTLAARPFMRPAFDKELPNVAKWYEGSVK